MGIETLLPTVGRHIWVLRSGDVLDSPGHEATQKTNGVVERHGVLMNKETDRGDCPNCILGVMDAGECRNCHWVDSSPFVAPIKLVEMVDPTKFAAAILGTNWWDWEWWAAVKYDAGFAWDAHPVDTHRSFLTVKIDNPDYDSGGPNKQKTFRHRVSVKQLVDAYVRYHEQGGLSSWLELDMIDGDNIMQTLVFGKVVFG